MFNIRKTSKNSVLKDMHAYLVTNIITGFRYVGITSQNPPLKRWRRHISEAKRGLYQTLLHRAIREYGKDAFQFEVIVCPKLEMTYNDLLLWEKELIAKYGTLAPAGYNMTIGGQGTVGYKWSDESRRRLSIATKGRSMAHVTAASNKATKGKALSLEHRAKIGDAHRGRKDGPHTPEHRARIAASGRGKKRTKETKQNIALALRNYWNNHPRPCSLYSPQGILTNIPDLRIFCAEHNLTYWKMKRVAFGNRIHCDGWKKSLDRVDKNKKAFSLISPTGEIINGIGLRGFAIKNSLNIDAMKQLVAGKRREYMGWKKNTTSV